MWNFDESYLTWYFVLYCLFFTNYKKTCKTYINSNISTATKVTISFRMNKSIKSINSASNRLYRGGIMYSYPPLRAITEIKLLKIMNILCS